MHQKKEVHVVFHWEMGFFVFLYRSILTHCTRWFYVCWDLELLQTNVERMLTTGHWNESCMLNRHRLLVFFFFFFFHGDRNFEPWWGTKTNASYKLTPEPLLTVGSFSVFRQNGELGRARTSASTVDGGCYSAVQERAQVFFQVLCGGSPGHHPRRPWHFVGEHKGDHRHRCPACFFPNAVTGTTS